MLHRAASSGHSRDDSCGTVGMCCHGPAVFCSFLNHLAGTRGDGRWLSQSFPTLLLTNQTNPQKKLSNDPPESQVSHSSNLHQEVRAERGFLRRMRPSILWFSLNWFPKNYEPNTIPRFLGRCLLLGPARGGYQLELLVVRAVSDHWIEAVFPLQSTHTARDIIYTSHIHISHCFRKPDVLSGIIHRSIKSSFRKHYVLALTPATKYTYQKILQNTISQWW